MHSVKPSTIAMLLAALALGTTAARAADDADLIAKGQRIAEEHCNRCHAVGASDTSRHEKAPPFRLVVERYPSENLAEALAEGIMTGHADMPVFVFDPPAIEAFLAYLNSLPPSAPPRKAGK
jgi:mono/diheme cytochrome c family protein